MLKLKLGKFRGTSIALLRFLYPFLLLSV